MPVNLPHFINEFKQIFGGSLSYPPITRHLVLRINPLELRLYPDHWLIVKAKAFRISPKIPTNFPNLTL